MKNSAVEKLKKFFPVFVILLFDVLLFIVNYRLGAYLVGWDALFPELNFSQNIQRSLFSIWQEYRGMGVIDGLSFAANLPHYLFIYLLSLFLSQNLLRYFFVFLMHYVGGVGIYFLLRYLLTQTQKNNIEIFALLGALFYQYNFGVLQMFYTPFEPFLVHFTFLPWLIWSLTNYLESSRKKFLILFGLFSVLSIPQAHVPTVFFVYSLALFIFSVFFLWQEGKKILGKILIVFLLLFAINTYWGLPYAYSVLTHSKEIAESKINLMATEDIILKNKVFGDFESTVLLKGYTFNIVENQPDKTYGYLMKPWRDYVESPFFKITGYFFFLIALIGVVFTLTKKQKLFYPLVVLFVISFLMLGNNIPILHLPIEFISKNIPLFNQVFRFNFTKFIILFAFCLSIFWVYGLLIIKEKFALLRRGGLVFLLLGVAMILINSLPSWKGYFLYENLRLKIPKEYLETINYFKAENVNSRIAIFPQPSYWDWTYTNWNYRGSGFLWFGLPQAVTDSAFNPWSRQNENYYWEASYALYSQNQNLFEKVLEKYQINWLLLDENIISSSSSKSLYIDELKEMIANSSRFQIEQQFGNIGLYRFQPEAPIKNYVFMVDNISNVMPNYKWNNFDQAYLDKGTYISDTQYVIGDKKIYYPFRSLFTGKKQENLEFAVEETADSLVFKNIIPSNLANYQLILPEKRNEELIFVDPNDLTKTIFFKPEISFEGDLLMIKVPKIKGLYGAQINPINENSTLEAKNCNKFSKGEVSNQIINEDSLLRLNSTNALNCSQAFSFLNLPHNLSYLITVNSRNVNGKSLLFWLENPQSRKADLETYLPQNQGLSTSYFIQPPMTNDGLGYILHFDNNSIGDQKTVNDLGEINLYQIPYYFLTSLKLVSSENQKQESNFIVPDVVEHPNPNLYKVQLSSTINHLPLTIVLSQSYNEGWQAYSGVECGIMNNELCGLLVPMLGEKIKDHVLVNNWENGWSLDSSTINHSPLTIYLVYLPQYLEYLGFGLLLLLFPSFFLLKKLLH